MHLSKETIENVQFTTVDRKFYVASEVDDFLDELAELVAENTQLLAQLTSKTSYYQQLIEDLEKETKIDQEKWLEEQKAKHSQLLATSRSLYYSAIAFKEQTAADFQAMQEQTDQAIAMLEQSTPTPTPIPTSAPLKHS